MRILQTVLVALCLSAAAATAFEPTPGITGTFSNLRYNDEGGDLLGLEILIVPAEGDGGGYIAFVQIAEGAAPHAALVPVKVTGSQLEFSFPQDGSFRGMKFSGLVTADGIIGGLGSGEREVLKRGISYWNKPAL